MEKDNTLKKEKMLSVLRPYLPFLTGLFTGIIFFSLSLTRPDLSHVPGDLGDARFNNYILEHAHLFITAKIDAFWNAPFLYPEENVITYSDNLLGTAPFYSFFRGMGIDKHSSFQLWFILISALNYAACYFFLLYLFKNRYAAVLGAMVFAYSIALQSQITHAQTFPRFAIPLAFWMGMLYLKELRPRYFFGALFFLVYQFYCAIYLGFMLFIPLTLLFVCSLFKWRLYAQKVKSLKWWGLMLMAIALNIALILPVMLPYLERSGQMEFYAYEKVLQTVPTLKSFFYSHYGSLFWNFLKETGVKYDAFWDHQIFAGGIAILSLLGFMLIVIVKLVNKNAFQQIRINTDLVIIFSTALLTFLLFIRFQGYSLYQYIYPLPGFGSMRALQRIINVELVFYTIATAFLISLILKKENNNGLMYFLLLMLLFYLDNHVRSDATDVYAKEESWRRVTRLVEKMQSLPPGSVISYEPDSLVGNPAYYQLDAMLAAQPFGLKTLNGYTSISPYEYSFYWVKPNEESRLRWLKQKGLAPDKVVVIH